MNEENQNGNSSQSNRLLNIRVTAKAKHERIVEETLEDGSTLYRVYVTDAPEDGKTNKAVISLLASHFKVPKSHLQIRKGEHSKNKLVTILNRQKD